MSEKGISTKTVVPALANDLPRNLMYSRQHTPNPARNGIVWNRAVGDCEMGFFLKAGAANYKLKVLDPGGWSAGEWRIDQRLQDVPDFQASIDWPVVPESSGA